MAYTRRTLAELDQRLRDRLDAHAYYTLQDRHDALRMALKVFQAATGQWRWQMAAYAVPRDWLVPTPEVAQVLAVRFADRPLLPTTIPELSHLRPNWRREVVGEGPWPQTPYYWAPVGATTIAIWPVPATSMTGVVTGLVDQPVVALAEQGLPVDVADGWVEAIVNFAAWWCAGAATPVEQDKYQGHLDHFLAVASQIQQARGAQQAFRTFQQALTRRHPLPSSLTVDAPPEALP